MPATAEAITALCNAARQLAASAETLGEDSARRFSTRLRDSVVRPLDLLQPAAAPHQPSHLVASPSGTEELDQAVFTLAVRATQLAVQEDAAAELIEASAALEDLSLKCPDETVRGSRLEQFGRLMAGVARLIRVSTNGPYLVTSAAGLSDYLGQDLPGRPLLALCRCGESAIKPLCDGSHARVGFTDAKDPQRVPDRREAYVGQQVTILDNRGICQHAGFCTDRLSDVFRLHEEPFVAPSGGRMDEIIRAVRDCPSGALSYAIDGVEARDHVDYHGTRGPGIEVCRDGPYRVTGGIPLVDHNGVDVARNQGASAEHYALCRCGHSQNKPFCSGMHYYVEFHDPEPDATQEPTIFEWAGGLPALTRMTRLFYEKHVPQDPLLAPLFATMSEDHPQRVAKWLGEVFCGPRRYSAEYGGYPRMLSQHLGKRLTEQQRERWVTLLLRSAREAHLPNDAEFRSAFEAYIEWGSRLAVENSQSGAQPPQHMPMPRWDWHTAAGPPGSRISALAPPSEEDDSIPDLPAEGEPVSFDSHIKPLFRDRDQRAMSFAFDLWSYDDVSQHADQILERLQAGTMPCDRRWPAPRIEAFQRWVEAGKPR
ncbi:MAG: CDGSH iron-sulfur domain-containing protein [Acidimicrobiaceae bacterium]|nr:CDGSH iron-sulfur domain-containing protein [Acidimicrobiaceae bacterium]